MEENRINEGKIVQNYDRMLYQLEQLEIQKEYKMARFLLTMFLGCLGSFIINHSPLKPKGFTSKTFVGYFLLGIITFGIYNFAASICNLCFNPHIDKNVGYFKD